MNDFQTKKTAAATRAMATEKAMTSKAMIKEITTVILAVKILAIEKKTIDPMLPANKTSNPKQPHH